VLRVGSLALVFLLQPFVADAQDDRRDYPSMLARGFAEIAAGHISYPFSQIHMEPGHRAGSVQTPSLAARVTFGYRFDDTLSGQVTYLRPARWVEYRNVDGTTNGGTVWMNVAGLTMKARTPVTGRWSAYAEAGLGIVTRHGLSVGGRTVVADAVFATPLVGGGADYQVTEEWRLTLGGLYSPGQSDPLQPRTVAFTTGMTYLVTPRPAARPVPGEPTYIFPEHLVQLGFTTNALGYGFNTAVSPIFWQGDVRVDRGVTLHYQRNLFHTKKLFSLDWGASLAYKRSDLDRDRFLALSIFPLFRFTAYRTTVADFYFSYSLAGPTFISKTVIDGQRVGKRFTFQDLLGLGAYAGRDRRYNLELRVGHYSNGNLIPRNPGIKVPLTFNVGYAFTPD
jgi:opacity protein-like surface antigen